MAQQDYTYVMNVVLQLEGGYGWDRADPGGPTKWGITCFDLAEYEGKAMNSMADWVVPIKNMTIQVADAIYATKYKVRCRFDDLLPGVDMTFLDYGINSGIGRPIKIAQRLVGVTVDGHFGPITLKAINSQDATTFINEMNNERLNFLKSLPTWNEFGGGWGRRVTTIRNDSLGIVKNGPPHTMAARYANADEAKRSAKAYGQD